MAERAMVLGGSQTRVVDEGQGPAVVLVHSTPFDLEYWSGLAAILRPDHRVIRYDLPGHGAASGGALPGIERLACDVVDLLDALDVASAHVVGHSLGATIGQRCALDHPARVRRLSLLGVRASPSSLFTTLADALRRDAAARELLIQRCFTTTEMRRNGAAVRYVRGRFQDTPAAVCADGLDRIAASDFLGDLARLTIPVDVVAGEEDHGATPEHARDVAAALPHARLHIVPRARPLLALEHPEVVASLLR